MTKPLLATVIICTYNRASYLSEVFQSVISQNVVFDYEVIIVNNNSVDDTERIAQTLIEQSAVSARYVFEPVQGLSHARNRGIAEAHGEIVVFIDDDAIADPDWLGNLVAIFDDPKVGCAGGQIKLLWQSPKPDWIDENLERPLGRLNLGEEILTLKDSQTPYGGNIAFRRRLLTGDVLFAKNLGRDAISLLSNEELEVCAKIVKQGWLIKYAPQAIVHHMVSPDRLRKLWFYHRHFWQGVSNAVLDCNLSNNIYVTLRNNTRQRCDILLSQEEKLFKQRRRIRLFIGYVHYLLQDAYKQSNSFRQLRILETYFASFWKASSHAIQLKDSLYSKLLDKYRQLEEALHKSNETLKQMDDQLKQMDESLRQKDEAIRQKDETIRQKDETVRQKDEILKRQATDMQRKDAEIAKLDELLQEKNAVIKAREERIDDLLTSMSWKITAPLRKTYDLLGKKEKK